MLVEELSRDQLVARLVEIYRWESAFEDFDHFAVEVKAINALLISSDVAEEDDEVEHPCPDCGHETEVLVGGVYCPECRWFERE